MRVEGGKGNGDANNFVCGVVGAERRDKAQRKWRNRQGSIRGARRSAESAGRTR